MSLYHVYFSNDNFIVFMIALGDMDHNAEIWRVICHLRDNSATWRGEDELQRLLLTSLEYILQTISRSNDALYSIESYRKRKGQEYANGLAIMRLRS